MALAAATITKRYKKPFVLLELLVAFALVSTCALPFLRYPMEHLVGEIDTLFKMELARVGEEIMADAKAALYMKKVPASWIFDSGKREPLVFSQERITVELPSGLKRSYDKKVTIFPKKRKTADSGEVYALLAFVVDLTPLQKRKTVTPLRLKMSAFCTQSIVKK